MDGKFGNIINKVKEFLSGLSSKTKKMVIILLAIAVVFSVGTAIILNNKPYEILFTGLNSQEASEIIGKLQEEAISYKYEQNGTILVPKEQEQKLKAQLVYEGYPKSGFTYNMFKDNIDMMSTDFEKNSYKLYELQDRMAATISLFEGVKEATVTIALGEDRKYVLDSANETEASASVVVIMKDGGSPTVEQVKGIQRLVSKSIPQLTIDNVVVLDGNGNDVTAEDESTQSGASKVKLELEKAIEDKIKAKILNVVNPIYGAENVRVSVKGTVDMDKKIREMINYTPKIDGTRGIPSDISTGQEIIKGGDAAGGVPGTETNADIPIYNNVATDGTETYIKNQNDINYLVDMIKEQSQVDAGSLQDLSISVAINGQDFGSVTQDALQDLIAKAAGVAPEVQAQKISLLAAPFYRQPVVEEPPDTPDLIFGINKWLFIGICAGIGLLLLIILIVIIVLLRRRKRHGDLGEYDDNLGAALAGAGEDTSNPVADLLDIKNEKGMELKNKIRDFSEENPEISAQLLKTWLRGGESDGE